MENIRFVYAKTIGWKQRMDEKKKKKKKTENIADEMNAQLQSMQYAFDQMTINASNLNGMYREWWVEGFPIIRYDWFGNHSMGICTSACHIIK